MSMGMCGYAWACMCHKLCVEVGGQHVGVDSLPPPSDDIQEIDFGW